MFCKLYWRIVRLTYPGLPLVIALWTLGARGTQRQRGQVRFWKLYSHIDFTNLLAIARDLIQPEYWV